LCVIRKDINEKEMIATSFDGTWGTRGFTSNFGFATYIGFYSKKVIYMGYKCKYCHICSIEKAPPQHICTKNWTKSSGKIS
jgi:hypothetical protein